MAWYMYSTCMDMQGWTRWNESSCLYWLSQVQACKYMLVPVVITILNSYNGTSHGMAMHTFINEQMKKLTKQHESTNLSGYYCSSDGHSEFGMGGWGNPPFSILVGNMPLVSSAFHALCYMLYVYCMLPLDTFDIGQHISYFQPCIIFGCWLLYQEL